MALLSIGGAAGSAAAADLSFPVPTLKAASLQATTNWTGLFIGAEGGRGWGTDQLFFPGPLTRTSSFDTSGAMAGGVIGYNWQAPAGNWLFGVEASLDWADIHGAVPCPLAGFDCSTRLDAIYAGTGRVGYAWGNVLLYAKGGYAWSPDRAIATSLATGAIVERTDRVGRNGYTLGAGADYMFAPNWSAKIEYDYYKFDRTTVAASTPAGTFVENVELTSRSLNIIKGGVNYHFNWVPPAVLVRN
jgi:outer membrane immunogenic protein